MSTLRISDHPVMEAVFSSDGCRPDALVRLDPVRYPAKTDGEGACGLAAAGVGIVGWRTEFEDEHLILDLASCASGPHILCAVFDGHGGNQSSSFAFKSIQKKLEQRQEWTAYAKGSGDVSLLSQALTGAFLDLDEELGAVSRNSGCTACVAVISPTHIVCANAGDSRCVLGRNDGSAVSMSEDHKPDLPRERLRIEAAGGTVVEYLGVVRLDGCMALSRGLGDFSFKANPDLSRSEQKMIAVPDVTVHVRDNSRDALLILACDGVWDVFDSAEALSYLGAIIADEGEEDMLELAEELVDRAFEKGSKDNISAVVVRLPGARVGRGGGGVARIREARGGMEGLFARIAREPEWYTQATAPTCNATPAPGSLFFGLDE